MHKKNSAQTHLTALKLSQVSEGVCCEVIALHVQLHQPVQYRVSVRDTLVSVLDRCDLLPSLTEREQRFHGVPVDFLHNLRER